MKLFIRILIGIGLTLLFIILTVFDIADRTIFYSRAIPNNEIKEFHMFKNIDEEKEAYQRNYSNSKYLFPREVVKKAILYKNQLFISRLTSENLTENEMHQIIDLFNDPTNFDWDETTWSIQESEYILRFFNSKGKEVRKVWVCLEDCGMLESIPFAPTMKFGALSMKGREELPELINEILK